MNTTTRNKIENLKIEKRSIILDFVFAALIALAGLFLSYVYDSETGLIVGSLFGAARLGSIFANLRFNKKVSALIGQLTQDK